MINSYLISHRSEIIEKIIFASKEKSKIFFEDNLEKLLTIKNRKTFHILYIDLKTIKSEFTKLHETKAFISAIKQAYPLPKIIIITTIEQTRKAVDFVRAGAYNYITEPIFDEEIRLVIDDVISAINQEEELKYLRDEFWNEQFSDIVQTNNIRMKQVYDKVKAVAPTKSTVLITGETGTGKGVLAKLIHYHSNRSDNPYIAFHCGAMPDSLIESELFGHERGAFTSADRRKLGKFEIAHKGTMFLDEIGTISPSAQIKLLEVIQDKSFQRVGGEQSISVDTRILTATNEDLKNLSLLGRFRKDLYYRINVFPIDIPPLRERSEDIEHLANLFLRKLNKDHLKEVNKIHSEVLDAFKSYSWPGNVRELENLIERAYLLEKTDTLTPEKFPDEIFGVPAVGLVARDSIDMPFSEAKRGVVKKFEYLYLDNLLKTTEGKMNNAATKGGFTTRYLRELLEKHKLDKKDYKSKSC